MKINKIAIFGATGRVGSLVTKQLIEEGYQVLCIGRNQTKLSVLKEKGANILTASFDDHDKLAQGLIGYDLVLTMVPSNHLAEDFYAEQRVAINAQIHAIQKANVPNVINLSSLGAHLDSGIGILNALYDMEQNLNELTDIKVVHYRPSYYMENAFYTIPLILMQGINGINAKGDHAFPMVSIKDTAAYLVRTILQYEDHNSGDIVSILGPRDYTLQEFTTILGNAIGKPNLPFIEFTDIDMKQGMLQGGAGSESFIDLAIELYRSFEGGSLNSEIRTPENTTPTTAEAFAAALFVPAFQGFEAQMMVQANE